MDRLTKRVPGGIIFETPIGNLLDRLAAYEDTGLEPEEIKEQIGWLSPVCFGCEGRKPDFSRSEKCGYERDEFRLCLERSKHLVDLVKAEQEGRLVVLPCKVGDTVYVLNASAFHKGKVYKGHVSAFRYSMHGAEMLGTGFYGYVDDLLNKTVFLTRAEAEKAMEVIEDA